MARETLCYWTSNVRFRIASINNVSDVMTNATCVQYLQEM